MNKNEEKKLLNNLTKKYEVPEFIPCDPVKFPHMFDRQEDQEVVALIASSLAYGKRDKILSDVQKILDIIDCRPYEFVFNFDYKRDSKTFDGFIHRYTTGRDVALLIFAIGKVLKEYESLKNIFLDGFSLEDKNIKPALVHFVGILRNELPGDEDTKGVEYLLPHPDKGSACKRLNMFLRWMVRQGPVDLHLWKEVPTNKLIIPLDAHVSKLSRKLNLTERRVDDWKTAEEITENLKEFDPNDPVKYDFAIFGMGVSKEVPSCII